MEERSIRALPRDETFGERAWPITMRCRNTIVILGIKLIQ
jgi:hypothetical protein